jgi:hypothetical protein
MTRLIDAGDCSDKTLATPETETLSRNRRRWAPGVVATPRPVSEAARRSSCITGTVVKPQRVSWSTTHHNHHQQHHYHSHNYNHSHSHSHSNSNNNSNNNDDDDDDRSRCGHAPYTTAQCTALSLTADEARRARVLP